MFYDATSESGSKFAYEHDGAANKVSILESLGGGVAMADYDNDGLLDLAYPGGGKYGPANAILGLPLGLFRGRGDFKFEPVANVAHIDIPGAYSHGIAAGDFDRDGFVDYLITGYDRLQLWQNLGDGTFAEIAEQRGLIDHRWSTSAAWGDVNGDGQLDLYVAHYVNWSFENDVYCPGPTPQQRELCAPRVFEGLDDVVFYNNGDGTFHDATHEAGLVAGGKGLGVLIADLDSDGDSDIYVANDTTANFLYLNNGQGKLEEVARLQGAAVDEGGVPNGSMGVDVCDYNQDGLTDIFVANFERESFALYANQGDGQFIHSSRSAGVAALGGLFVGFGSQCGDFDLDGDEDIAVANGHITLYPINTTRKQTPLLLLNDHGFFRRAQFPAGTFMSTPHEGRGLAAGDLDHDGDLDVSISQENEPVVLLRNDLKNAVDASGKTTKHWLQLRLIGRHSNRDAIGTRVVLHTTKGDLLRHRRGGGSYCSSPDPTLHWGIPTDSQITGLTIYWPGNYVQEVPVTQPDQWLTVIEPLR